MNVKKPEQPRCSSLTERQWKNIIDEIEYIWDMGQIRTADISRFILRGISELSIMSLICPREVEILKKYNADCRCEYVERCEELKKALADRIVVSTDDIPNSITFQEVSK